MARSASDVYAAFKVAAAVLVHIDNIWIAPGTNVFYLAAAAGTTVSHGSDIVGPTGAVYSVELSHHHGRDLLTVAKQRANIIPMMKDAQHPLKYRMLLGMVDTIISDVAQGRFKRGLLH
jgi:rRNA 2'-O-methyltransferase fibrillarin